MAESATIARPYAEAIFGLADKTNALPAWSRLLATMAEVAAHPEVLALIGNPNLTADRLYGLFVSLCGGEIGSDAQNFVRILIGNDRLALLPEIRTMFEALKNEREGVIDAVVTSAFPLDAAQIAGLVADLERRFKRRINPKVNVDPELIGGVHIAVGDEVIDGTVRGKLAAMASDLLKA